MRAVVTGATGFVGSWLVKELLANGDKVVLLVRNESKVPNEIKNNAGAEVITCDLSGIKDLNKSIVGEADVFYHFAWNGTSGNLRADEKVQLSNVQYTVDAVRLAKELGAKRFVFAGSIMEYESIKFVSADGATPSLANIYSTAKLAADYMAKIYANSLGVEFINIIISNIYGAGEKSARFLNTTVLKLLNEKSIDLSEGKQLYDFIYVTDAVRAIRLAGINGKSNNNYYIGNKEQFPLREFVVQMKEILKSDAQLNFGAFKTTGNFLNFDEFDTSKIHNELGFEPEVSFHEGVELTKNWLLENA